MPTEAQNARNTIKVFVTGAAGFVGSAILRALRAHGHETCGMAINSADAVIVEKNGGRAVVGDLTTDEGLAVARREAVAADGVIHAVKVHRVTQADPPAANAAKREEFHHAKHSEWERVDELSVDVLLDALAGTNKPFIFSSTCSIYGDTGEKIVDESTPVTSGTAAGVLSMSAKSLKRLAAAFAPSRCAQQKSTGPTRRICRSDVRTQLRCMDI